MCLTDIQIELIRTKHKVSYLEDKIIEQNRLIKVIYKQNEENKQILLRAIQELNKNEVCRDE